MDLPDLYQRLVTERLGGFCYEHQLLTYFMLGELGFEVYLLDSQVVPRDPNIYDPDV